MPGHPTAWQLPPSDGAELVSRNQRATRLIGERLGQLGQPGDLILLEGDLGAGKTALTQGIAQGLGITAVVNSPTFTLVKEYAGRLPLYHIDLYRLDDVLQVEELGIEEYLESGGVCVVEWAERAAVIWPSSWLRIRLIVTGPHERLLRIAGAGERGAQLCHALVASGDTRFTDEPRAPAQE
jgi:tRNA threonylcarbamoyladenosine biosynthesis protein TsaE